VIGAVLVTLTVVESSSNRRINRSGRYVREAYVKAEGGVSVLSFEMATAVEMATALGRHSSCSSIECS